MTNRADEAERAVVGAVFLKPDVLDWLDLDDRDFLVHSTRKIFTACKASRATHGTVDTALVEAELRRLGAWEAVGETAGLRQCVQATATASNVQHYAKLVRDARLTRDVLEAAAAIALPPADMTGADLLERALALIGQVAVPAFNRATTLGQLQRDEFAAIRRALEDKDAPAQQVVPTGIGKLDEYIGGLPRGLVSVVAGRPGTGKSTVLRLIAAGVAARGGRAVLISYEDPGRSWAVRSLAAASSVELARIDERSMDPTELMRVAEAALMKKNPLDRVHFLPGHGLPPERALRAAMTLGGGQVEFVGLDYIQNAVRARAGVKKNELIEAFMVTAQEVAAKTRAAVCIASQFKRSQSDEPTMQDLKESGALEEGAKLILGLAPVKGQGGHVAVGLVRFLVMKHHARMAQCAVVVGFDGAHSRFE